MLLGWGYEIQKFLRQRYILKFLEESASQNSLGSFFYNSLKVKIREINNNIVHIQDHLNDSLQENKKPHHQILRSLTASQLAIQRAASHRSQFEISCTPVCPSRLNHVHRCSQNYFQGWAQVRAPFGAFTSCMTLVMKCNNALSYET